MPTGIMTQITSLFFIEVSWILETYADDKDISYLEISDVVTYHKLTAPTPTPIPTLTSTCNMSQHVGKKLDKYQTLKQNN